MAEWREQILALAAGALLGGFFFGGLWWTIRRSFRSSSPALWFLGSLLFRTCVVVGGFYIVSHQDWRLLLACVLGFLIARSSIVRFSRMPAAEPDADQALP